MPAIAPTSVLAGHANLAGLIAAAGRNPGSAIRFRRDGHWVQESFDTVFTRASDIARGLIAIGVRPGERVAILGATVPEWTLADLGALSAGTVVVPIYHTNAPGECAYVLEHSGARAVFVEDEGQLEKIRSIRGDCADLEHVIALKGTLAGDDVIDLDSLIARGHDVPADSLQAASASVALDDPATIVYTSGTTGPPKGCVMTHGNILAAVQMYEDQLVLTGDETPRVFMFLPLAHVLARIVQFVTLGVGGELGFWSGDATKLLDDLQEIRPTHFPSVPRVFEKIRSRALAELDDGDPVRRALFGWATRMGARTAELDRAGRKPSLIQRLEQEAAQRLVLAKVQALFGGDLRRALTGAAPIGREVLDFFSACGITILEGYGMTETCAAATLNTPSATRFGTVGRPLPGVEIRIAADGEILMRGPNVSPGYHHNHEATAETWDEEGWLHSGDLGQIDQDGYLAITGRQKDLIITSSGKNISPSNIETSLQETRWISHAVVYGDGHSYLVALVAIDETELGELAEHAGVGSADAAELAKDPAVHELIWADIQEVNAHFATIEQIKRFDILERDLTQADGELTPTMKVRRGPVYERYRDRFEVLYDG